MSFKFISVEDYCKSITSEIDEKIYLTKNVAGCIEYHTGTEIITDTAYGQFITEVAEVPQDLINQFSNQFNEQLIAQIEELKEEVECNASGYVELQNNIFEVAQKNRELEAQIEKMKCCNNCADGKSCENSGLVYVCEKWRFEK